MYRARFTPQAWQNDYAVEVDPKGPTEWDVTPTYIDSLLRDYVERGEYPTREAAAREVLTADTYESDELRFDPAAPKWVADWDGPFYVEVWEA